MGNLNEKTKRTLANFSLLLTGAIWGGGFVVMKNALSSIPVNYLLALRFAIAAAGLSFSLFRKPRPSRKLLWQSAVVGALLYTAFAAQTYGLMFTTAGKSALITALYVVLVPLFGWALTHKRPEGRIFVAGSVMLLGIALLSLGDNSRMNMGDLLTLLCGVLYAAEIIAVGRYGEDVDTMQFTCLQFAFASLFSFLAAGTLETFPRQWTGDMFFALAYCSLAATLMGITLMNVGIRYATPAYASLFMSTESAFGCLFGVLLLGERMTPRMLVGCAMILIALVISQLDLSHGKKLRLMEGK